MGDQKAGTLFHDDNSGNDNMTAIERISSKLQFHQMGLWVFFWGSSSTNESWRQLEGNGGKD